MISWAEGVISVAEPPITFDGSESGGVFGSVLVLPESPSHTTDGLNSLSKKMLGGGDCIALCADACQDVCCLIVFLGYMVKFEPFEPS